jgi:hypothetical protein
MTQSTVHTVLIAMAFPFLLVGSQLTATAQEAVSPTSSSGSTATSSAGATGSIEPNANLSTTATGSPTGAVTGSTNAGPNIVQNPNGVGVFSPTPLQILATLSGGYDDNVSTAGNNKQSSAFTSGNVILDYTFGEPRLQLTLNGGAGGTYYFSNLSNQNYDIDLKGAFAITYKASPRLTLGSTVLVEYLTEPTFNYAGGLNSRNGNYLYTTDKLFLEYAWSNRFSTRTSYTFEAYNYDKESVATFSNRVSNLFGNEFRLQLVPTTHLVAEYRFEIVSYPDSSLNSTTHFALGGIDHTFNPRLTASLRGGAEFRSYENDGDRTGPYFEGNVTYALGRRTSVSWISRYGLEEPDLPGVQSRTTFRTGLQTKFNMTSRTSAAVDIFYVHDDYHPLTSGLITTPAFSEDTFDAGLTLRYGITSLIGVQASYHYTDVSSEVAFREYSRNRVSAGVNVTF